LRGWLDVALLALLAVAPPGYERYVPGYVEGENAASALSRAWEKPASILPGAKVLDVTVFQRGDDAAMAVARVRRDAKDAAAVLQVWAAEETGCSRVQGGGAGVAMFRSQDGVIIHGAAAAAPGEWWCVAACAPRADEARVRTEVELLAGRLAKKGP
jgi:hypothetical protein